MSEDGKEEKQQMEEAKWDNGDGSRGKDLMRADEEAEPLLDNYKDVKGFDDDNEVVILEGKHIKTKRKVWYTRGMTMAAATKRRQLKKTKLVCNLLFIFNVTKCHKLEVIQLHDDVVHRDVNIKPMEIGCVFDAIYQFNMFGCLIRDTNGRRHRFLEASASSRRLAAYRYVSVEEVRRRDLKSVANVDNQHD
ncbi:hypothetical protein C1H46_010144 [Malus baccata]|uniref:Uncharacterized protein n=1 Tax=Malus baccata TaxID=106549 RepID=A0A540MZI7_MALBA|nr:hypothetical protein C1H46_010144 [Malus baccata]